MTKTNLVAATACLLMAGVLAGCTEMRPKTDLGNHYPSLQASTFESSGLEF